MSMRYNNKVVVYDTLDKVGSIINVLRAIFRGVKKIGVEMYYSTFYSQIFGCFHGFGLQNW